MVIMIECFVWECSSLKLLIVIEKYIISSLSEDILLVFGKSFINFVVIHQSDVLIELGIQVLPFKNHFSACLPVVNITLLVHLVEKRSWFTFNVVYCCLKFSVRIKIAYCLLGSIFNKRLLLLEMNCRKLAADYRSPRCLVSLLRSGD